MFCRLALGSSVFVAAVSAAVGQDVAAPPRQDPLSHVETLQRALARLPDGPCRADAQCRSWMDEVGLRSDVIAKGLVELRDFAATVPALEQQRSQLQADVRTLEQTLAERRNEERQLNEAITAARQALAAARTATADEAAATLGRERLGMGRSPASAMAAGMRDERNTIRCGSKEIVLTLFGYFEHDRDVSLKEGPADLSLKFTPYILPESSFAKAMNIYQTQEPITLVPSLDIHQDYGVEVIPPAVLGRPLRTVPEQWRWKLAAGRRSRYEKAPATISMEIRGPSESARPDAWKTTVALNSWWDYWTSVKSNWKAGVLVASVLVFLVIFGVRRTVWAMLALMVERLTPKPETQKQMAGPLRLELIHETRAALRWVGSKIRRR